MLVQLGGVPHHRNAGYSDLLISHWPNAHFLRTEIRDRGEIPLWNPLILSGAPLAADPLFNIWYPPSWLTIFLPITVAFNLLFLLHLAWAGFGMYIFLRAEGKSRGVALLAGLAFGGTPKLIGHIALGHIGLVSAVAWTPWVLTAVRTMVTRVFSKESGFHRWAALSGLLLALIFFADPRWLIPVAFLVFIYTIYYLWQNEWLLRVNKHPFPFAVLIFVLTSLGISSGLSLPLTEFIARTTRADITTEVASEISFPLDNLIKLIVPDLGGWPETLPYVGIVVIGLAVIGVFARSQGWKFWFLLCLGSLVLAMGDQTPIYGLIAAITPGLKYARVPARFLFMSSFCLAVLAGLGFEALLVESKRHVPTIRLAAFGFGVVGLFLGVAFQFLGEDTQRVGLFLSVSAFLFMILFFISIRANLETHRFLFLWMVAILLELMIFRGSILKMIPIEEVFEGNKAMLGRIANESELQRTFSTSYSIPQQLAAKEGLELTEGVNPLQLKAYHSYMAGAVGFPEGEYSVTLPPFPDGDPSTPQDYSLNADDLGMLNVAYVISEYPVDSEGLALITPVEGSYVYRNEQYRPRVWIAVGEAAGGDWRDADSIEWSPNEIVVGADGPGTLVLSEMMYPGWVVDVDGERATIEQYEGLFRSVHLETGGHIIRFSYRPTRLFVGAAMTLLSLLLVAWLWIKR
jgi:hypothetical protein